jgi:hypothetical protein
MTHAGIAPNREAGTNEWATMHNTVSAYYTDACHPRRERAHSAAPDSDASAA